MTRIAFHSLRQVAQRVSRAAMPLEAHGWQPLQRLVGGIEFDADRFQGGNAK